MSGLELDFVVYLGDPDEGAEALESAKFLAEAEQHKAVVTFPDAYGALTIRKGDKDLLPRLPDPVFGQITNMVRAVQSLVDGEPENQQWSESEHGISIEPDGDDVIISVFVGGAYDPEEFLIQEETMTLDAFGEQVLSMGKRLASILEKVDPDAFENDDYLKGLTEFLELSGREFKTFRLAKQRGLRV